MLNYIINAVCNHHFRFPFIASTRYIENIRQDDDDDEERKEAEQEEKGEGKRRKWR